MPYRQISKDLKERAVWMREAGYLTDDICTILDISERSICRWQQNVAEHGDVIPPHNPLQGRPFTLNAMQVNELVDTIRDRPEMFLDEIREHILLAQEIDLAESSIHRILKDLGFTYKYLRKVAKERDEDARQEFMERMNNHYVAEQLVFVDESSKDDRTIFRKFGWAPKGQQAEISTNFVHGTRYSIIAAITIGGYISTHVVEGSVDGPEFFQYIIEDVVSQIMSLADNLD